MAFYRFRIFTNPLEEDFIPENFADAFKAFKKCKVGPETEKFRRQTQEVLFKEGFSCMLWIMETRQKERETFNAPPKMLFNYLQNSDGEFYPDFFVMSR